MSTESVPAQEEARGPEVPVPATSPPVELALVLERATGSRLLEAERLLLKLPALLGRGLEAGELYISAAGSFTALVQVGADGPAPRRRLAFWCARSGARLLDLADLGDRERAALDAGLARSDVRSSASPALWAGEVATFFDSAGASPWRVPEPEGLPELVVDVGGAGWSEVRWDAEGQALFLPGALAPPVGDELRLCLRTGGISPCCRARVGSVREEARPGLPSGFTLEILETPPEVAALLDEQVVEGAGAGQARRAYPRYPVRAPALVAAVEGAKVPQDGCDLVGEDGRPRYLIEDLSEGGAFIRTAQAQAVGARLHVTATLPTGDTLRSLAEVVFRSERGMGVRWLVEGSSEAQLAAVVARTAARPRRALVVYDDAQALGLIAESLQRRGFEVLTASDGVTALQILSEELLSLDLLLADVRLPKMDGEALLRTVRQAGGESDLAIAMMAGRSEPGLESRLERAGADVVLRKDLGPQVLAQAAAAALERKRRSA